MGLISSNGLLYFWVDDEGREGSSQGEKRPGRKGRYSMVKMKRPKKKSGHHPDVKFLL